MVVLLECSPISTEELCQSDHGVLGHLPDQGPSFSLIVQFRRAASSRKDLGGSKLLPFKNGDLQCCRNVLVLFSVPRHNSVYGQFLRPHGLVFALTCTVNWWFVCAFPNYVQSIEFTTGGLQSSCRNISRMINEKRMDPSSISSVIAKGLNTYVNKVFMFFILNKLANISENLLSLCHYGVLCVYWWAVSFFFCISL